MASGSNQECIVGNYSKTDQGGLQVSLIFHIIKKPLAFLAKIIWRVIVGVYRISGSDIGLHIYVLEPTSHLSVSYGYALVIKL